MHVNPYIAIQTPEEDKDAICNHRLTAHFKHGLISDLVISKHRKKYGHARHQMSLLKLYVIKQYRTQTHFILGLHFIASGLI